MIKIIITLKREEGGEGGGGEGGGVDVEMWGLPLFYYFTVQLHLLYVCRKSKVSFITFRFFSLLS